MTSLVLDKIYVFLDQPCPPGTNTQPIKKIKYVPGTGYVPGMDSTPFPEYPCFKGVYKLNAPIEFNQALNAPNEGGVVMKLPSTLANLIQSHHRIGEALQMSNPQLSREKKSMKESGELPKTRKKMKEFNWKMVFNRKKNQKSI